MAEGAIVVYGTMWCDDCRRARRLLDRHGVRYHWIDIEADSGARAVVLRLNRGQRSVPTILFPGDTLLVEPTDRALAAKLASAALRDTVAPDAAHGTAVGAAESWRRQALAAGLLSSLIASLCCLPAAVALAVGLSLGTAASLARLLAFQPAFQAAGILIAGSAAWWLAARRAAACRVDPARRVGAPLYVLGAFAVGFVLVNQALIPLLERLPWLLAGK